MRQIAFIISGVILSCQAYAQEIVIDLNKPLQPLISVKLSKRLVDVINIDDIQKSGSDVLRIYAINNGKIAPVQVSSKYSLLGKQFSVTPIVALGVGLGFEVHYYGARDTIRKRFETPVAELPLVPAAIIEQIFPLSDTLISNILFFHVRFSQPMLNTKEAYNHVKIYDDKGLEQKDPWRQRSYWLDSNKVLVLMIHPGRVKRGIHSLSELGPVFKEGGTYTLVVEKSMQDEQLNNISEGTEKTFVIIGADHDIPQVQFDQFKVPSGNTKNPLQMKFFEGMDYAGLIEGTEVNNQEEKKVEGKILWQKNDEIFFFIPDKRWVTGSYTLIFNKVVCDFAGNRLNRPFEIERAEDIEKDNQPVKWSFEVN